MVVVLINPVPSMQCSLSLTPLNHFIPSLLFYNLVDLCFPWRHFSYSFPSLPFSSLLPHLHWHLVPEHASSVPSVTFLMFSLFSLLDANQTHASRLQSAYYLLWKASIANHFNLRLTYIWTQILNLLNMEQGLWRKGFTLVEKKRYSIYDITSLPSMLGHVFFEGMIVCQPCVCIPMPSAFPRI